LQLEDRLLDAARVALVLLEENPLHGLRRAQPGPDLGAEVARDHHERDPVRLEHPAAARRRARRLEGQRQRRVAGLDRQRKLLRWLHRFHYSAYLRGMPTEDDAGPEETRDEKSVRRRLERVVPDLVKRTFYAGLGAVFTTEEGIRKLANEFSLPKDVVAYLVNSAASTKDELYRIVAKELRGFLEGLNLSQEMAKLLTTLSFEIK